MGTDVTIAQRLAVERLCGHDPHIRLLMLYGSRARGDARPNSDWDFGYIASPGFDASALLAELIWALRTERVDLVDLAHAGALIRYRVAREGVPIFSAPEEKEVYERFWVQAVSFWCDAGRQIQQAYAEMLKRIGP